ncbi:fructose-bisphosphate aldolase class I [Candidatus Microgenomates bacterium]|nr:fructose-bisphosphate aldolase class I [Candidatus Microgenomates bacterium]
MDITTLKQTAQAMMVPPKGLLAADESTKTITKRFDALGIECTAESILAYRQMLFTTPGVEEFLSGIILFDETIRQSIDGKSVCQYLESKGIIPGIKVDKGVHDLANFPNEKVAEGLDGLRDRLTEYKGMGAKFAKFRATIQIGEGIPTDTCIEANSEVLARYAALCQEQDIVPVVEPEVLLDGDHTIEQCFEAQVRTLKMVFERIKAHKVALEGMVLKPSMVLSGKDCPTQADSKKVAQMSVDALKQSVPPEVGGIAFLSGGQSDESAVANLLEINKIGGPWPLTFSYSRGLQNAPMKIWAGKAENIKAAQEEFYKRCKAASLARSGKLS